MCTAATYKTKDHYFGRNMDFDFSYNETVTVTPRKFPLHFRKMPDMDSHYAMIGMAMVSDNYPLYYEATNEKGLSIAGLHFAGYAEYKEEVPDKENVASFEFILWILGQCANISEVRERLSRINIVNLAFSDEFPPAPLHWMISDREESIVVECVKEGLNVYDNPAGVLTNNPPFDQQYFNLRNYMQISNKNPKNTFSEKLQLEPYSRGMGGFGLPGDLSSASRFVKATFTRLNSCSGDSESESVSQFFHILGSVYQQRGCVDVGEEEYEITIYSSCCNTDKGIYYYTTYENSQITGIDMFKENLQGDQLVSYPLVKGQQIRMEN